MINENSEEEYDQDIIEQVDRAVAELAESLIPPYPFNLYLISNENSRKLESRLQWIKELDEYCYVLQSPEYEAANRLLQHARRAIEQENTSLSMWLVWYAEQLVEGNYAYEEIFCQQSQ